MVKQNATLDNKNEHKGLKLDSSDLDNIRNALAIYDKLHPRGKVAYSQTKDGEVWMEYTNRFDHLEYIRSTLKQEAGFKHLSNRSFDQPIRLQTSVPPTLEAWLTKGYPKLFTDERQTKQFIKEFPEFDLARV